MTPDPHDAEAVWRSPMMQPEFVGCPDCGPHMVLFPDGAERVIDAICVKHAFEPPAPRTFPVNFAIRAHTVPDPDSVAANAQRYRSPT